MTKSFNVKGGAFSAALCIVGSSAQAHSFGAGTDAFGQIIEGASVPFLEPVTLLCCLALGLLHTLWRPHGVIAVMPHLIIGQIVGFLAAPHLGQTVYLGATIIGIISAVIAGLFARPMTALIILTTVATGFFTITVALEGHHWLELPLLIYLGIFLGSLFAVILAAGLSQLVFDTLPKKPYVSIGLRVVASWLAAIQIMMLASQIAANS